MAASKSTGPELRSLPLSDVHAHVFDKGRAGVQRIVNLARREKLEKIYLICTDFRDQLAAVRENRDIARMLVHYAPGDAKDLWKAHEKFVLDHRDCVAGVKLNPSRDEYVPSVQNLGEVFASAEANGFTLVTHTDAGARSNAAHFKPLMKAHPETRLVLYHADPLKEAIALMKAYPNVCTDISSTAFSEKVQRTLVGKVGADRIMFGIDTPLGWPQDSHRAILEHYRDVIDEIAPWYDNDPEILRKVLHGNSARVFGG